MYWDHGGNQGRELEEYQQWYAEKRIKLSLEGISPIQYRMRIGFIAT